MIVSKNILIMKAIKYLLAGALISVVSAPSVAQDVKSQVETITKVVVDNKSNPAAIEDQVKDFVKENKKNAEALAGLGRAFLEIKDTASAREYATMALDRGKDNKGKALASILLGDLAALSSNEGGGAASYYNHAYNDGIIHNPMAIISANILRHMPRKSFIKIRRIVLIFNLHLL